MASERSVLTGNDPVSDQLISHVSRHVVGALRKQFATGPLGLRDEQYDNIEEEHSRAERRNQESLRTWRNKSRSLTVQMLLDKLPEWQQKGYISANVWDTMRDIVDPNLLPVREAPADGKANFNFIKKLVKRQLRRRCRNALSTDWLPDEKAKTFPLRDYYSDLGWKKKVKRAMRDTSVKLKRIHDIFDNEFEDGGINVAVIGRAGTGKTSSMAMLALDWVNENEESSSTKLSQFDLVFLIELRYVNENSSLEQIIIKQHGLKGKSVSESQIRSILEEQSVLLILDGYDEYQKGTNADIDSAIEDTVGECFLILTSRDGDYISKETLDKFDGEIVITGFNDKSMFQCAEKYLKSEEMAERLIWEASNCMIEDLLQIPIILLMACVLFFETRKLPTSHTAIIDKIVEMCLDRSALKHFGRKALEIPGLEDKLYQLGELSWRALKGATRQLLLPKAEIVRISEDLLKLGILHGTSDDEARTEEQPEMLTYAHKLFQEYWAAYYASKRLTKANSKDEVDRIFNVQSDMERHWNVLKFTCGLMEDSSLLIEKVCQAFVEIVTRPNPGESFGSLYGSLYLKDLNREKSAKSVSPFNNAEMCYVRHCNIPADSNYPLYYFNGWDTSQEEECSPGGLKNLGPNSTGTAEKLQPCSVIIQQGPQKSLVEYYRTMKRFIEQPIRKLLIFGEKMTHSPTYGSILGDSFKATRPLSDSEKKPPQVSPILRDPECESFEEDHTLFEPEDELYEDARSSWEPDWESVEVSSSYLPTGYEMSFEKITQSYEHEPSFNIRHYSSSLPGPVRNFSDDIVLQLNNLAVAVFQKVNCSDLLSDSLKKCTKLTHLAYIKCRDPSFDTLGNNKGLKELTVENCSHDLKAESDLCEQLIHLTQLEQITFRHMKTEATLAKIIRDSVFSSLISLKKLSLQDCMLTTPTAVTLMTSLVQCPLVELDLSDNYLRGFINELHQIRSASFKHLERMSCNNSNLLETDTTGLARLILENRLPTIKIVFMKGNELAGEKTASEELDKSCEHFRKKKGHRVQVFISRKEEKKNGGRNDEVKDSHIKDEEEHPEKESSRSNHRKRPEGVIRSFIRTYCNIL